MRKISQYNRERATASNTEHNRFTVIIGNAANCPHVWNYYCVTCRNGHDALELATAQMRKEYEMGPEDDFEFVGVFHGHIQQDNDVF